MKEPYKTKDLKLASYLLASGFTQYTPVRQGSIIYFQFDLPESSATDNLLEIQEDSYWQDSALVSPKSLFIAFDELRLRIRNMNL